MRASLSHFMALVLLVAVALPSAAQDDRVPPIVRIKGQVVSVTRNTLRVRVTGGAVKSYVLEGAALARVKDLKPGCRVVGTVETDAGGRTAIVAFSEISPPEPPVAGPGTPPGGRRSHILVTCDLACQVAVDFKPAVTLPAGGHATLDVDPGERMVTAKAPSGESWRRTVKVGGDQVVVDITLAGAAVAVSAAEFDGGAAALMTGLLDVRGARSYVAWVLEKKSFGFHDVELTVSLQRADAGLKRAVVRMQAWQPADAGRARARDELLRTAEEAAQLVTLLSEAVTAAQQQNTSLGKPAQLRAQALAHLPLMAPERTALAPLALSDAFRTGLSRDRWPDAGVAADPQDFQLGADYDGDTPPRLGEVPKGSLADALGLRAGDRVVSVDGRPVRDGWELKQALRASLGKTAALEVVRDGKREVRKAKVPASLPR